MVVPKEDLVHGKLRVLPSSDKGQNIASEEHLNNSDSAIELYFDYFGGLLPLLKVSLKGQVLYIFKPFSVPQAKQPASWLNPMHNISSLLAFILIC